MRSTSRFVALLGMVGMAIAVTTATPGYAAGNTVDPLLLAGLKARAIGPATMSGRVAAVVAKPGDPATLYVGAATGGVWKTTDSGTSWKPLFDDQPVAAIGALAISPAAPEVVWVGTGEGNVRNSASVGNGVYRSEDGGATWAYLGLEKTERVTRLLVHPENPNVAWVAALGQAWGENPERGVFKTIDGGRNWRKVLYVDERTGAADLAIDPSNPMKLIAAMWDYRRWPWLFRSGGPSSGLHVSHDGGETWKRLTPEDGLPSGDLGRIGVAIAPSDPLRVYALVEAKENALYRSDDGARTFRRVSASENIGDRPFYYSDLRVDPADRDRVYSLWTRVSVSTDGGEEWEVLVSGQKAHSDHHALWINPADPRHLVLGNDGGVSVSRDHGENWSFIGNLPLAQYYHVRVDNEVPYNIYGGLQDNGSWRGPAEVWENSGIRNHHWREVGFGDGFDTAPHPNDATVGYSMSQEGNLMRWSLATGERKDIRPGLDSAPAGTKELRFNWNAAFAQDPFEPDTIFYGSQFVHRSKNRGDSWETISSDLTTNRAEWQRQTESGGLTPDVTGAENFTTLIAIEPSPVAKNTLWVGSDDGRLHLTRDGGKSWVSVEGNLKGVPANTYIPHIHASSHDAGTAFVVLDDHRRSNFTTYVYKTTDFGKTWRSLVTSSLRGWALAIVQDPVDPNLLFLGTEFGLWVSLDGGAAWLPFRHGVPTVAVADLVIQKREADLIIGTHGRALYVLDDLRPLRELAAEMLAEPLRLFTPPPAQQYRSSQPIGARFNSGSEFRGENAPYGAVLSFTVNQPGVPHPDKATERARKEKARAEKGGRPAEEEPASAGGERRGRRGRGAAEGPEAEIEITDASGAKVRSFKAPVTLGVNRAVWDLRRDDFRRPATDTSGAENPFRRGGLEVLPGTYQVTVRLGKAEAKGEVTVVADPRESAASADRQTKYDAILRAGAAQTELAAAIDRISQARRDLDSVISRADTPTASAAHKDLAKVVRDLKKELDEVEKTLWHPETGTKGIIRETAPYSLVTRVQRSLGSSRGAPTPAQLDALDRALAAAKPALDGVTRFFTERVEPLRVQLETAGLGLLAPPAVP